MKSKDLCELAISHFKKGKKPAEIEKILDKKAHLSTICRWIKSFKKYNKIVRKVSTGRPRSARTKRLINQVKRRLKSKNPRKSTRTMGNDFGSNKDTVRRVLVDLGKIHLEKLRFKSLHWVMTLKESNAARGFARTLARRKCIK